LRYRASDPSSVGRRGLRSRPAGLRGSLGGISRRDRRRCSRLFGHASWSVAGAQGACQRSARVRSSGRRLEHPPAGGGTRRPP
jgi:hypothetical protein